MYYENGRKMSEADYKAGVLNGTSTAYYETAKKKAEADTRTACCTGRARRGTSRA
jgi:antitoxin component YwqK of YwqJK toxin-antitoxin module